MFMDSTGKIFQTYISQIVRGTQTVNDVEVHEKEIVLSPMILREIKCACCGGCCNGNWTIDYLPEEPRPKEDCDIREVAGKIIYTARETGIPGRRCYYNDVETGFCRTHDARPLTCDFECIRFKCFKDKVIIGTYPYGRSWQLLRCDGGRGSRCIIGTPNEEYRGDVLRRLHRLKQWIDYYGIETYIQEIISAVKTMPLEQKNAIIINPKIKREVLYDNSHLTSSDQLSEEGG